MATRSGKPRKFSGRVVQQRLARGSKSEHIAICIDLRDRTLKLRRAGGNPFVDAELQQLLGKRICVEGELLNATTVLVTSWRQIRPRPVRRPQAAKRDTRLHK